VEARAELLAPGTLAPASAVGSLGPRRLAAHALALAAAARALDMQTESSASVAAAEYTALAELCLQRGLLTPPLAAAEPALALAELERAAVRSLDLADASGFVAWRLFVWWRAVLSFLT
jgi:hypothetical protein